MRKPFSLYKIANTACFCFMLYACGTTERRYDESALKNERITDSLENEIVRERALQVDSLAKAIVPISNTPPQVDSMSMDTVAIATHGTYSLDGQYSESAELQKRIKKLEALKTKLESEVHELKMTSSLLKTNNAVLTLQLETNGMIAKKPDFRSQFSDNSLGKIYLQSQIRQALLFHIDQLLWTRSDLNSEILSADIKTIENSLDNYIEKFNNVDYFDSEIADVLTSSWLSLRLKSLASNEPLTEQILLEEAAHLGRVLIVSVPEGAELSIDGSPSFKTTNTPVWFKEGSIKIRLYKKGYKPLIEKYTVKAQTTSEFKRELQKE